MGAKIKIAARSQARVSTCRSFALDRFAATGASAANADALETWDSTLHCDASNEADAFDIAKNCTCRNSRPATCSGRYERFACDSNRAGCAVNPATGRTSLTGTMSTAEEIRLPTVRKGYRVMG